MLNVTKQLDGNNAVFSLEGRLDTVTAPDLEKELRDALPELQELTLDFEKLDYISSAGLRVLLSTQKTMVDQGGDLKIVHVKEAIMEVFEITGFIDILTIE